MQYDFNFAANGGMQIDVQGSFIKYKTGTGAIRVVTSKGGYIDLLPGQGVWGMDFTRLTVQDRSGSANKGVLLAGAYDFRDQTIPGTVGTADGSALWTSGLNCFTGTAKNMGTTNYAFAVLANPAGSGKNLIVKSVKYVITSGSAFGLFHYAGYTPAGNTKAKNKKLGGPASLAILESVDLTAAQHTAITQPNQIVNYFVNAQGTPFDHRFEEPLIIVPGDALFMLSSAASGGAGFATFDWREE